MEKIKLSSHQTSTKQLRQNSPERLDVHIGDRIRLRCREMNVSHEMLSEALGITLKHVGECLQGAKRVNAALLYDLSRFLDVRISFFYEDSYSVACASDADVGEHAGSPQFEVQSSNGGVQQARTEIQNSAEAAELLSLFYCVESSTVRRSILRFIGSLAKA